MRFFEARKRGCEIGARLARDKLDGEFEVVERTARKEGWSGGLPQAPRVFNVPTPGVMRFEFRWSEETRTAGDSRLTLRCSLPHRIDSNCFTSALGSSRGSERHGGDKVADAEKNNLTKIRKDQIGEEDTRSQWLHAWS